MARYGMDYDRSRNDRNRGGMMDRDYDRDFRTSGYGDRDRFGSDRGGFGVDRDNDRNRFAGRGYDRDFGRGGYGGSMRGQDREIGLGESATFGPRGGYDHNFRGNDRDFGDRLREGWNDVRRNARNFLR